VTAVVVHIHPKAMTVILTTPEEVNLWLAADMPKALELQRPLPDDAVKIVASGEKEDRAPEVAYCSKLIGALVGRLWAESGPKRIASGMTGVRAAADIPLRERNSPHRPFETIVTGD
jgi:hypothetical protein